MRAHIRIDAGARQAVDGELGALRVWNLILLAAILGAVVVGLVIARRGPAPEDLDLQPREEARAERPARREPSFPEPSRRHAPAGGEHPRMIESADRQRALLGHLREGTKSELEMQETPDIPVSVKGPPAPRGGPDELDPDVHDQLGRRALPEMSRCYQRRLASRPTLAGSLVVSFNIVGAEGKSVADKGEIVSSTLNDFELESCVLKSLGAASFPLGLQGGKQPIQYPVTFGPVGEAQQQQQQQQPAGSAGSVPPASPPQPPREPQPSHDPPLEESPPPGAAHRSPER